MPWYKSPQWGWALHLGVSIAPILINMAVAFATDPSNPLGLNPTVLALIVTLANVLLSQLRNAGQTVVTLGVNGGTGSSDIVTVGRDVPNIPVGSQVITMAPQTPNGV